jgi:PTH1 family peptidyl-tRNA hydrolase
MKLIVGLGNPGERYQKSRHNVGFILLDKFAADNNLNWRKVERFNSEVADYSNGLLIKPQTFMNNSGDAVSKLVNFYKISLNDLIIIHDDVDLPLGAIKKQKGKNSAGHHGVENIIEELGTKDFWRIRVGIGKPEDKNIPIDEWVLQNFGENELDIVTKLDLLSLSASE